MFIRSWGYHGDMIPLGYDGISWDIAEKYGGASSHVFSLFESSWSLGLARNGIILNIQRCPFSPGREVKEWNVPVPALTTGLSASHFCWLEPNKIVR